MSEIDYAEVLSRIQNVYSSCSKLEQKLLYKIVEEAGDKGYSYTLEQLWLTDFKEVPVSIEEFICSPFYMGEVTRNGDAVYPFWKATVNDIFSAGNKYNEIILSGATRIGKTSTAVLILAYMLYRLMLYRNPHEYFQKKQISKFTIGFANLTKDLAAGVAYREFNDTLKACPWFQEHGRFSKSVTNFYYIPEGDKIDIVAASDGAHMLGMQIWACLTGSTKILTSTGQYKTLESLEDQYVDLIQTDPAGNLIFCQGYVAKTKYTNRLIRITLEDGTVIEGTPDHKLMLADGTYKQMSELTSDDELYDVLKCAEKAKLPSIKIF